ncbi:hypothetical protein PR202_gb23221 [Eleusine coracana subsp. coracana]|uniref:Uncharacterized protein n=1 Tax=Eleusine coracana subsp. coracana TaxID=191504 RepID=A0AAV5FID3_ELECO|nr:hypothetical protein PR202_gb23221 [Eleusine coracana subsp. coracana]
MCHLKKLIYSTNAHIIFILEVKTNKFSPNDLINHFSVHDSYIVPAEGISRGLWLLWKDGVEVTIVSSSANYILANVKFNQLNTIFRLVCMYGDPYHGKMLDIWADIVDFANSDTVLYFVWETLMSF